MPLTTIPRREQLLSRTGVVYIFCPTRLSLMAKSRKHRHDNALDTGGALRAHSVSSQGSWQMLRDFAIRDNWVRQNIYTTTVLDNTICVIEHHTEPYHTARQPEAEERMTAMRKRTDTEVLELLLNYFAPKLFPILPHFRFSPNRSGTS